MAQMMSFKLHTHHDNHPNTCPPKQHQSESHGKWSLQDTPKMDSQQLGCKGKKQNYINGINNTICSGGNDDETAGPMNTTEDMAMVTEQ